VTPEGCDASASILVVLLRQRGQLLWNRVTRGPGSFQRKIGATFVVVFTIGFIILAGLNAGLLVDRVARSDPVAAVRLVPVLLAVVSALTLVTSLSSAFHHLFLAGDLELLLVAPVPTPSLFGLKVFEIWRASLHIVLFAGAALFGFGQSLHMPLTYYVLATVVGLLLTLGASAVGATLTLGLARVRFGESILGLSRILAIVLLLPVGVLGLPSLGFGRNGISLALSQNSASAIAEQLRRLGEPHSWAPTTWGAHVLLADEAAGLSLALLLLTVGVLFAAMQVAFDTLFQPGFERVRFSEAARPAARTRRSRQLSRLSPRGPIAGLVLKDWRTVIRDPRWRTGTLVSLVALGLPAVVWFAGDPFVRTAHVMHFWYGMLPVPYLAYLFGSQQGASALVYEGRNLALLRASPVSMGRIVLAKLIGGLGLVLLVTWATTVAVGLAHNGEPLEMVAALLVATWLALGATLCAVAGAALTADFESDNPQRRVGCLGTIVTSGLSVLFFGTNVSLLGWWVARSLFSVPRPLVSVVPILDWGLPIVALVSVAGVAAASLVGVRRLANWEFS
jgi:hypothetical protein